MAPLLLRSESPPGTLGAHCPQDSDFQIKNTELRSELYQQFRTRERNGRNGAGAAGSPRCPQGSGQSAASGSGRICVGLRAARPCGECWARLGALQHGRDVGRAEGVQRTAAEVTKGTEHLFYGSVQRAAASGARGRDRGQRKQTGS